MIFHLIILSLVLVLVFLIYWHYDNIFPTGETEPKMVSPNLNSVKSIKNHNKKPLKIKRDKLSFIDSESEHEPENNSIDSEYFNKFVKINENTNESQDTQDTQDTQITVNSDEQLYNPDDDTDKSNQTF